ncbi:MAG: RNA polymerase sigma factor [Candidatus Cryptobacteroides sp.]
MKGKTGSKLTDLSDLELIGKAREQDQMAFVILYQRYYGALSAHVSRFISNREDLEDVCIESFQKAFSRIDTYKEEYMFSTWLFRIGQNTAFDHLSKRQRKDENMPLQTISQDAPLEIPSGATSPEETVIHREEYDKWLTVIDLLKGDYKTVAKMFLIDNFGYNEIAEALDIPLNTVKTKIRRARAMLMKMMDTDDELL